MAQQEAQEMLTRLSQIPHRLLNFLSEQARRNILGETAAKLFKIDTSARFPKSAVPAAAE